MFSLGEEHSDRTSGAGPKTPEWGGKGSRRRHDTTGGVHQRTGETGIRERERKRDRQTDGQRETERERQ